MKAHVYVTLKTSVLDPQGQTIQNALRKIGFAEVTSVRQGKYFALSLADGQFQVIDHFFLLLLLVGPTRACGQAWGWGVRMGRFSEAGLRAGSSKVSGNTPVIL